MRNFHQLIITCGLALLFMMEVLQAKVEIASNIVSFDQVQMIVSFSQNNGSPEVVIDLKEKLASNKDKNIEIIFWANHDFDFPSNLFEATMDKLITTLGIFSSSHTKVISVQYADNFNYNQKIKASLPLFQPRIDLINARSTLIPSSLPTTGNYVEISSSVLPLTALNVSTQASSSQAQQLSVLPESHEQLTVPISLSAVFKANANVLAVFQLADKQKVIFTFEESNQVQILLEKNNETILIPSHDIEGIPSECFSDVNKLKAFLSQSYVKVLEYLNSEGFKIRINLKLLGGGHMGVGIQTWPVVENKVVIPYKIEASSEAARLWNCGCKFSSKPNIQAELNNAAAIFDAISEWNATDVVELLNIVSPALCTASEYGQAFGCQPPHWIKFSTTTTQSLCRASCIGRCDHMEEQPIICDLTGEFKDEPVQSIMHEIGHAIGLRHEHVREDRDAYVSTNFHESTYNAKMVGPYDFRSIMHYAFGDYPGRKYLYLQPQHFLTEQEYNQVGKRPRISRGDIETVRELYQLDG